MRHRKHAAPELLFGPIASGLVWLLASGLVSGVGPRVAWADFTSPVVVTDNDVAEPGIDVASDGTLYINAPVGLGSSLPLDVASLLFRSDDGGTTWIRKDPGLLRGAMPGGGDSDVALPADDMNRVYYTDLYLADSTVSVSNDRGETWSFSNPAGGVPVHDRQWLATSGNDIAYHVYNQIPTGLWVSKSVDGGLTWILGTLAASVAARNGCVCPPGTMVAETLPAGSGLLGISQRVGVIYATSLGGISFARSTNGGITWSQKVISPNGSASDTVLAFPVVARASTGVLHAAWLEVVDTGQNQTTRVRYARSTNFGQSWIDRKTLVNSGTSVFPWIDARGSKVSVVLYHTDDATAVPDTVAEGSEWSVKYLESTNGGAWFDPILTVVDSVPVKEGPICTKGAACDDDRELLDFLQVAIDLNAKANVVWTRSIDEGIDDTHIRFAKQQ